MGEGGGGKGSTIAVQAEGDDGEDELGEAKREVEVKHIGRAGSCTVVPFRCVELER